MRDDDEDFFFIFLLDIWKTVKEYQKQYQISPTTKKLFKFWIFLFFSRLFFASFFCLAVVCVTVWKQLPSVYLFSTLKGIKRTKIKFIKTKEQSFYFSAAFARSTNNETIIINSFFNLQEENLKRLLLVYMNLVELLTSTSFTLETQVSSYIHSCVVFKKTPTKVKYFCFILFHLINFKCFTVQPC